MNTHYAPERTESHNHRQGRALTELNVPALCHPTGLKVSANFACDIATIKEKIAYRRGGHNHVDLIRYCTTACGLPRYDAGGSADLQAEKGHIVTYNSNNQTVRRYGKQFRSAEPIMTRDHATLHKFDDKY